jgi:chitodextrinase
MTLPKEAHGIYQESRYNTAPDAMVKSGQMSPPSQARDTIPFTQDARNQDAPESLQNKAVKVVDHESNTMQDSNTVMQQEG